VFKVNVPIFDDHFSKPEFIAETLLGVRSSITVMLMQSRLCKVESKFCKWGWSICACFYSGRYRTQL